MLARLLLRYATGMGEFGRRTIQVGITVGLSLGAIVSLIGCADRSDATPASGVHAMAGGYGLVSGGKGVSASTGLVTTEGGRRTIAYPATAPAGSPTRRSGR